MRDTQHRRMGCQQENPASDRLQQSIEPFQHDADVESAVRQQLPAWLHASVLGNVQPGRGRWRPVPIVKAPSIVDGAFHWVLKDLATFRVRADFVCRLA